MRRDLGTGWSILKGLERALQKYPGPFEFKLTFVPLLGVPGCSRAVKMREGRWRDWNEDWSDGSEWDKPIWSEGLSPGGVTEKRDETYEYVKGPFDVKFYPTIPFGVTLPITYRPVLMGFTLPRGSVRNKKGYYKAHYIGVLYIMYKTNEQIIDRVRRFYSHDTFVSKNKPNKWRYRGFRYCHGPCIILKSFIITLSIY